MAFLPLKLPPGIVRGANPDDAPGRWYDGSLIRWREGVMEPVGGWSKVTKTALASKVRRMHQWRRNNGQPMMLLGADAALYADNSGSFVDVSPSGLTALTSGGTTAGYGASTYGSSTYGTARTGTTTLTVNRPAWTFASWGEDAIAVASTDGRMLYYKSGSPTTACVPIGSYAISSISRTTNVATVVTSTAHNLTTGDVVQISGVTQTAFNTSSTSVTVTNATTFTYSNTGTDGSSSGGTVRDISVPTGNRGVVVTAERHVMLLQAGGEARRVAWSSREDHTDWNYASTTNTAGFIDIQTETPLLAGTRVREGVLVWSENGAFLMRYLGQPFIYGSDELGSAKLYAPNAYAEFEGRCAWMDATGFMYYEGGMIKQLPCPLSDFVFSNIDPLYGPRVSHAAVNGKFNEIWFFYPSTGSTECDRYVAWNWSEDYWSMGTLARTAAYPAGVQTYPLMAGTDSHLYQHENGWTYDGLAADNIYIASSTINIPGDEQAMHITQLLPSNGGNYALTKYELYTRMTPNGAERSFGPYNSRSDGYVDTRAVGRDVRIRISGRSSGDWSIGRIRMKVSAGGRR